MISANPHRNDRISYKEEDASLQIDTTEVDPGRANSQLILRYYVDRQSFPVSRWQPGVPMTSTGCPQTPRLLDLEAIYTLYLFIYHLLWGEAMFIDHLLWGEAMFIDHLCTGEEDACNLICDLLRFQLGTSC